MLSVEVTVLRAFKVFWSFLWRTWVLSFPVALVMIPLVLFMKPFPAPGEAVNSASTTAFLGKVLAFWVLAMIGMVLAQTFAMRWMLEATWSDFKLVAVARTKGQQPQEES